MSPLTFVLHFTFGASWGYDVEMLKLKVKTPPLKKHAQSPLTMYASLPIIILTDSTDLMSVAAHGRSQGCGVQTSCLGSAASWHNGRAQVWCRK